MSNPYRPFDADARAAIARGFTNRKQRYGKIVTRIPTGGATTIRYGLNKRVATPAQLEARINDGYEGAGAYRRKRMRMRGRGGFWGDLWAGTQGLRGDIGRSLRGGSAGAWGNAAGHAMQALGVGEYVTNSLVNGGGGQIGAGVPSFSPGQEGSIMVIHEEYLSDVFAPPANTFANQTYDINVGLEQTFPWLAQIAQNYDEYEIKQLMFTYRSSIAPLGASGTGQVGTIIMATQYNPDEQPFNSKGPMLQYAGSRSARVIDGMIQGVECNPNMNSGAPGKFTRAGPVPVGADIKTYDIGRFNMAVSDVPGTYAGQSIGELYVSYTVELRKPKFFEAAGFGISRDFFALPYNAVGYNSNSPMWPGLPATAAALLRGQQNRIGVSLSPNFSLFPNPVPIIPASTTGVGLLFPPDFYGNLKVVARFLQPALVVSISLATPPELWLTGNVRPVNDMLRAGPAGNTWLAIRDAYGSDTSGNKVLEIEFHIQIEVASGGIPNQALGLFTFAASLPGGYWHGATLDISEYNAGFNYLQDGTNDQIVLVGPTGGVVVPP